MGKCRVDDRGGSGVCYVVMLVLGNGVGRQPEGNEETFRVQRVLIGFNAQGVMVDIVALAPVVKLIDEEDI